jgi:alpha-D-ribose 1-methylphosphonate 5-triphosphate synthase subunit PhnH
MTAQAMKSAALAGGFAEPVFDAQGVFRAVMDAMARPGKAVDLSEKTAPPAPLSAEAGAVALTLFDHEAPVWLGQKFAASPAVADWLRFHTGCPIVTEPDEAAFALVSDAAQMPVLSAFGKGTAEYPDRSTTLIVAVDTFDGPEMLTLKGPGIRDTTHLSPHPLPVGFTDQAAANHALFPRGVDIIFTAARKLAALPRSTRITTQGA